MRGSMQRPTNSEELAQAAPYLVAEYVEAGQQAATGAFAGGLRTEPNVGSPQ